MVINVANTKSSMFTFKVACECDIVMNVINSMLQEVGRTGVNLRKCASSSVVHLFFTFKI